MARTNHTTAYRSRNKAAVPKSTIPITVTKAGKNASPHKVTTSETNKTANNTNSAGCISNGFDKRTMSWEGLPKQKEFLNRLERDGRRIGSDPEISFSRSVLCLLYG